MKYASVRSSARFLFGVACLGMASCGTSEYERRLNTVGLAAAKQGATTASFNTLLYGAGPIAANEAPTIRLPQALSYPYVTGANDDSFGGKPIAATELQPPGMQLPGFKVMWRGYKATPTNSNWPIYVYLSQQKVGAGAPLADAVMGQLNKAFPGKPTPWEDVSLIAEDGVTQVPWKKTTVKADMAFGVPQTEMPSTAPSTLTFYVHSSNEWEVLVGFRAPDEVDADLKFTTELADLTCGSVKTAP